MALCSPILFLLQIDPAALLYFIFYVILFFYLGQVLYLSYRRLIRQQKMTTVKMEYNFFDKINVVFYFAWFYRYNRASFNCILKDWVTKTKNTPG